MKEVTRYEYEPITKDSFPLEDGAERRHAWNVDIAELMASPLYIELDELTIDQLVALQEEVADEIERRDEA